MRKAMLNYEQVASAADLIKKSGREPSLVDICSVLDLLEPSRELNALLERWYHNQPEFKRVGNQSLTNNIQIEASHILEKNIELEKSLSLVRATLESTADGIMMVNGKGKVVDWNQKFIDMWRIPSSMMEDGSESVSFDYILSQLIDPSVIISDVQYLYKNPEWQGVLPELHFKDGRIFERYTQPQRVGSEIVGRVYSFRDVTERRQAEDFLRIRERAIEASNHGVAIIDVLKDNNPIIYVNRAFLQMSGYSEKDALGATLGHLQGYSTSEVNGKRICLAIREQKDEIVEVECQQKNGHKYWCEISLAPVKNYSDKVSHFVCLFNETTGRREMEQQLLQQATHDPLTELPNRVLLIDRVERAILQAKKEKSILAFMFIDLDRFKLTNDTLGHNIGDKLIQLVASRLIIATDEFDTVARLGGDEFFILLSKISSPEDAEKKAHHILRSIEKSMKIDQHTIKITASIGICYYPKDGKDYETLMKNADLSMYHAKDNGRNTYKIYETEMNSRIINTMQLDNCMRGGIKNNEFSLSYQPIVDPFHNTVISVEALLRWNNKTLGKVAPSEFIEVAEENGLIVEIGAWVLERSCQQLKKWHDQGLHNLSIAVNISSRQFKQGNLLEVINRALTGADLDPRYLELELTESLLIENINSVIDTITALKKLGVSLSIDDFGTGYSCLSYLKRFPVDKLKIDRSFISDIASDHNNAAIVHAVVNLGHSLGLTVLAEGVETEEQLDIIQSYHCDLAQGFYFSKPIQEDEVLETLINFGRGRKING